MDPGTKSQESDEVTWTRTAEYIRALGVDFEQTEARFKHIGVTTDAADGTGLINYELEKAVYIRRRVQGVPVLGDKLLVTYELQGPLRGINGQWHPVEYQKSQSISRYNTEQALVDAALEKMVELHVNPFFKEDIKLMTAFSVVSDERTPYSRLDMQLMISVPKNNGMGSYAIDVAHMDI